MKDRGSGHEIHGEEPGTQSHCPPAGVYSLPAMSCSKAHNLWAIDRYGSQDSSEPHNWPLWFAGDGASKGYAREDQAFGGWVGKSTNQEGVADAATQRPDVRPPGGTSS